MEFVFYAPVWGQSGFERLSRGLILALDQMGINIELRPANEWNSEMVPLPKNQILRLRRMVDTRVNQLAPHVIYQLPRGQRVTTNAPKICYTLFETDRVPSAWKHALSGMEKIFVFSEFNRKGWIQSGIDPEKISSLPQAVDSFLYTPDGPKMEIRNKKGFTFLCSGDYTERKNFEAVIEAYCKEFNSEDNVTLVMKCHYGGFTKSYRRECVKRLRASAFMFNKSNPPRILFWGDKITDFAMAALYRSVDCFILTSRGEGLGMQYLEAMASGTPIIACDWGAQTDYLNADNSYLVKTTLQWIDDPNYIKKCIEALNSKWCHPSIEDIREAMRHVRDNYAEASSRAQGNVELVRKMTWQKMAVEFIRGVIKMYEKKKEAVQ